MIFLIIYGIIGQNLVFIFTSLQVTLPGDQE